MNQVNNYFCDIVEKEFRPGYIIATILWDVISFHFHSEPQ